MDYIAVELLCKAAKRDVAIRESPVSIAPYTFSNARYTCRKARYACRNSRCAYATCNDRRQPTIFRSFPKSQSTMAKIRMSLLTKIPADAAGVVSLFEPSFAMKPICKGVTQAFCEFYSKLCTSWREAKSPAGTVYSDLIARGQIQRGVTPPGDCVRLVAFRMMRHFEANQSCWVPGQEPRDVHYKTLDFCNSRQ